METVAARAILPTGESDAEGYQLRDRSEHKYVTVQLDPSRQGWAVVNLKSGAILVQNGKFLIKLTKSEAEDVARRASSGGAQAFRASA